MRRASPHSHPGHADELAFSALPRYVAPERDGTAEQMTTWNDDELGRDQIRSRKREKLVMQAAQEFRRRGFHATSMSDIATALGVTKGALYRYVKSKDEVLFECFMHSNDLAERALARVAVMDGLAADKLASFMAEFIERYLDSNLAGGAMIEIDALLPDQRKEVVRGRDKIDRELRKLLEDGITDGSVVDENTKLMIFSFMGSINWIPSWFSPEGEFTTKEIADRITRIMIGGIRSREDVVRSKPMSRAKADRTKAAVKAA